MSDLRLPPFVAAALFVLLLAAPAARAGAPADSLLRAVTPADSLLRAVASPVPSAFAPTACVMPEDQDPTAIRRLLDGQVAAWNRGDLEGYMQAYWKSDSLSFYSGGSVTHGWQTTLDRYRQRYQGDGRQMGKLAFEVHDVTLPARGLALVRGAWSLRMNDSEPHGLFTLVLRWFPETGWRVVHDHSSAAS